MMSVEEKLAGSLTAETTELIPYLPYLLSDLWELGSSPDDMVSLISKNISMSTDIMLLDLACGKGAVSINIAKHFGCRVKGIDIMNDFITEAKEKAKEHGVHEICEFVTGDINQSVLIEKDYDIVIFGAAGDVLGDQESTLKKLSYTIKKGGYVLIDDAYAKEGSGGSYPTRDDWIEMIKRSGLLMIDDLVVEPNDLTGLLEEQMTYITMRVNELKKRHPDKAKLFDRYLLSQLEECRQLEIDLTGVTMLLKKVREKEFDLFHDVEGEQ